MSFLPSLLNNKEESWISQLQEARFRNIPFAVLNSKSFFGRQVAIHEYPFRDKPWVEDLGRASREITITGFLVQQSLVYGGGSVLTQRDSLVAACEQPGAGTLIHPTLGELTVSVAGKGLRINENWDAGRYFEFTLDLIESGIKVYPITVSSKLDGPKQSFLQKLVSLAATIIALIRRVMRKVSTTITQLKTTAEFWVRMVSGIGNEATNLKNTVKNSFSRDKYGRYNNKKHSSGVKNQPANKNELSGDLILAQQLASTTQARSAVIDAQDKLLHIETIDDFPDAVANMMLALLNAIDNPEDAIRSFSQLALQNSAGGSEEPDVNHIANNYFRQLSVMMAAYATADYHPTSYDDAMEKIVLISSLLKSEATIAADAGHDDIYHMLCDLEQSTVNDLKHKGGNLARIKEFSFSMAIPSLTLANRIYQNSLRSDELVQIINPIHPAFMPMKFKGLSK